MRRFEFFVVLFLALLAGNDRVSALTVVTSPKAANSRRAGDDLDELLKRIGRDKSRQNR